MSGMISRRMFAVSGLAAGVAAFAGASTLAVAQENGAAAYQHAAGLTLVDASDFTWDYETDVLVIGIGGAGASAALAAIEAGASVIAVEKRGIAGGCTAMCGQAYCTGGTDEQKAAGVEDTVEAYADYYVAAGEGNAELMRTVALQTLDAYNWLKGIGVTTPAVISNPGITFGGNKAADPDMVPRTHWTEGVWLPLSEALESSEATIMTDTPATALIQDVTTGEVVGAIVGDGKAIKANKGVLLSAGGFACNEDMVRKHITSGPYVSFAATGDTGDGIKLAESVGAELSFLNCGNDAPTYSDDEGNLGNCMYLYAAAIGTPGLLFVTQEGKRFTDESEFYVPINRKIMALPEGYCYIIGGGADAQANIEVGGTTGNYVVADTLEELAEKLGIDPAVLQATVDRWNECCEDGVDLDFGRTEDLYPIVEAPYCAEKLLPAFSSTLSGVTVNEDMQVIGALTGQPIPRLYAAGGNSSVIGRYYPACGSAVSTAVTTGRIAGRNIAALDSLA